MATAADVCLQYGSLQGKVYLVTGCASGIGLACAKALFAAGGTVVMACRAGSKAEQAKEEVLKSSDSGGSLHLLELDLGTPSSVESCAKAFLDLNLPLHALICNAGINGVPKWGQHTPGVETQFAVNFLGHYQLATLLDATLRATEAARLVIVSSESHRRVLEEGFDVETELPPREESYNDLHAYAFSNLCRIWWAKALSKRVPYPVVCLHPGVAAGTAMLQHMGFMAILRQVWLVLRWERSSFLALQSIEQAAALQTWAALAPCHLLVTGAYLNGNAGRVLGDPDTPSALAQKEDLAERALKFAEEFFRK